MKNDNDKREKALADRIENRPPLTLLELAADIASFGAGYDAAKAELLTIDREALVEAMNSADVDYSAREQRANAGGGDKEPGDWFTFIADAVIAHLSAQEAATEVEWGEAMVNDGTFEYTQLGDCDGSNVKHWRRTPRRVTPAGPWQEVPADE